VGHICEKIAVLVLFATMTSNTSSIGVRNKKNKEKKNIKKYIYRISNHTVNILGNGANEFAFILRQVDKEV